MRVIHTNTASPDDLKTQSERDWVYNGLDCCVTSEIIDALLPQLDEHTGSTYEFSKSLQGPALEMRLRGVLVDQRRKNEVLDDYYEKLERLERNLERIVLEGVGMHWFSYRSNPDLQRLFYDYLQIPIIRHQGRPTVNRAALEKMEAYTVAQPIIYHLEAMRDLNSKIKFLKTGIDPDGRVRTSYNIAGTSTGRFSSSYSEFGTGGNLQNVEESLRSVLISDQGYKFAKFDAKQIQSRIVGAIEWTLFKDGRYLDACEQADLHTTVAKMVWPELGWTGDPAQDKIIAEQPYYRHYTHRFMCKKLGHGSNFEGKPPTLAAQAKVPINLIIAFQPKYYKAFPAHLRWHEWVRQQVSRIGHIISITGRKREFWGRRNDDSTVREAIAYDPQASEAFIVNTAMLNIWRAKTAILMMQDHDALTFQYPEEQEDEIVPKLIKQLLIPVPLAHGRTLEVPYDAKVGWNKGEFDAKTNPDGLKDYEPNDKRKRSPQVSILDRVVRRSNR